MQNVLDIALENAGRHNATRIHMIRLTIGALSGVVPDALEFAFEAVTHGSIAEGARLELNLVPAVCYCSKCMMEYQPDEFSFECPQCHGFSTELRRGRELELSQLEVS